MNEYDSDRIADFVKKIDYIKTKNIKDCDCYVINTCHIREKATEKVFHEVGRLKKEFKNKKKPILIITGCVAQAEGSLILEKEKYVDAVVGPQSYQNINSIIKDIEFKNKKIDFTEFEADKKFDQLIKLKNKRNKVSAFLTIQEGCDKFCKFCVVPYTRGPEISRPFKDILNESKQLVGNGAKEIILLGQNVNAYSYDNKRLSDLIKGISMIKDLRRIRYTTSHPLDMSEDLIEVHGKEDKLMPMLHLPVQSGSDNILKKMNRKHSVSEYISILSKLKKVNKKMEFSSDFIIAYPEETKQDFEMTISLMKKIRFINSYSFLYSPRPGTPSSSFETIDVNIAKKRLEDFQKISKEIKTNYNRSLINKKVKVLFENSVKSDKSKFFGRDEHFNPVIVRSVNDISGLVLEVKIKDFSQNTLFGELLNLNQERYFAA
jgi:tRNA-2-methylthio-N6-dimethylallyladenosine synthase